MFVSRWTFNCWRHLRSQYVLLLSLNGIQIRLRHLGLGTNTDLHCIITSQKRFVIDFAPAAAQIYPPKYKIESPAEGDGMQKDSTCEHFKIFKSRRYENVAICCNTKWERNVKCVKFCWSLFQQVCISSKENCKYLLCLLKTSARQTVQVLNLLKREWWFWPSCH